jgi:elongation factor Ts
VQNDRGTVGVLVELGGVERGDSQARAIAHDIALHIASAAPRYVTRDEVPADDVARERDIYAAQTREEGKPEQAWPKIIEGKLNGFYKSVVLLEQAFVKDNKQTIDSVVKSLGPEAHVRGFARVKIGEE